MAAIPQRLEIPSGDEENRQRRSDLRTEDALGPAKDFDVGSPEIPIFCAGGCGEVMGFLKKGQSIPTYRCPACQAAEAAKASLATTEVTPVNTDELAELRSSPRDLRLIHIVQVIAVALIFAGSVCITMGRPLGIYLAAIGTLAWIAIGLVRWKLRD
jgi:hypothetical protein